MKKTYKMKIFIMMKRAELKNVNFLNIMFTKEMRFVCYISMGSSRAFI